LEDSTIHVCFLDEDKEDEEEKSPITISSQLTGGYAQIGDCSNLIYSPSKKTSGQALS
jgi:hypothetical protein